MYVSLTKKSGAKTGDRPQAAPLRRFAPPSLFQLPLAPTALHPKDSSARSLPQGPHSTPSMLRRAVPVLCPADPSSRSVAAPCSRRRSGHSCPVRARRIPFRWPVLCSRSCRRPLAPSPPPLALTHLPLSATQTILQKIPPGDSKLTYAADSILIHYQKLNGVVALVVAEDSAGRRMPFSFLAELHKRVGRVGAPVGASAD